MSSSTPSIQCSHSTRSYRRREHSTAPLVPGAATSTCTQLLLVVLVLGVRCSTPSTLYEYTVKDKRVRAYTFASYNFTRPAVHTPKLDTYPKFMPGIVQPYRKPYINSSVCKYSTKGYSM